MSLNREYLRSFLTNKRNLLTITLLLVILITFVYHLSLLRDKEANSLSAKVALYPHISVRALRENPNDLLLNFLPLRNNLRTEIAPWGDSFGMYFEYLPTGTSVNINGNNEFYAASLFKTPVVMALYHTRERLGKNDDPVVALKPENLDEKFGNLWKKGAGYKIKQSELVKLALEESDNTAIKSLFPFIGSVDFEDVYQGLDINLDTNSKGAILSAKSYSSIFKALYFAAVISVDHSELILNHLSKTIFPDKLVAGVPSGIEVAHKIGNFIDSDGNEAFTDCGIVYKPKRPYLLCMVSRTDEQTARVRMQDISKMIYDYLSSVE